MEGVGSRPSRTSARYGQAPVLKTGLVRKWKKQWVTSQSNNGNSNSNGNSSASTLVLCRWTPISANSGDNSGKPEERPRRKFRYTPIVVSEEKSNDANAKADHELKASNTDQYVARETSGCDDIFADANIDNLFTKESQALNNSQLASEHSKKSSMAFDFGFKNHDDNHVSDGRGRTDASSTHG
ncbi:hypothetical protein RJ639_037261 [Escallonia herrerae]|uniref:Uncharacterized protein n=1 Tax=Escallonia herrerae TaxID=1293975 RepID=A0AA88WR51_9ASTE|nr:hypothetical protein RJ639_037261 [Escallonia herrerae]